MRILYPADTFNPKQVDDNYLEEYQAAVAAGIPTFIFNFDDFLASGRFRPSPDLPMGDAVIYRGWMLAAPDYELLVDAIAASDCTAFTSVDAYLLCHHLPRWYPLLREYTAETRFYGEDPAPIPADLAALGWNGCFLKDYVKSLSTDGGSLLQDLGQIPTVAAKMRKYRGHIEGGLCARQVESYDLATERRYFVIDGVAHGDDQPPPPLVTAAAARIQSPFFSVDVARRTDGVLRIVELGDGQVSDGKHWSSEAFVGLLLSHLPLTPA